MSEISQIEKFRDLASVELNPKNTVKFCEEFNSILKRFSRNLPRTIKNRKELYSPFLLALGVNGADLRDENYDINFLVNKCIEFHAKKPEEELKDNIQQLKHIVETTIEMNSRNRQEDTVSTIRYVSEVDRVLTIVAIPKNAFAGDKTWIHHGSTYNIRPKCTNCGFYLSSGTSNEINFPNVWFPFLRVKTSVKTYSYEQERGWINKSQMLCLSKRFKTVFYNLFKQQYNEDIGTKYENTFISFFEKFSHWWQVCISAALITNADNIWNTDPFLLKVKILALKYDFDPNRDTFVENSEKITMYKIREISTIIVGEKPEEVNKWLSDNNALCLEEKPEEKK
jgi:Asp-tRNA(Asn)/Glu-tRNA(Gln) amidotransferase C subunit